MTYGSIRHHIRIAAPVEEVWAKVSDAGALWTWFPGLTGCDVEGNQRTIHLGSGLSMPEQIITNDPIQRRFQYSITAPMFPNHRGTIDVLELAPGDTLVVYATDADPRTMALTIGGATRGALAELKRQLETTDEGAA